MAYLDDERQRRARARNIAQSFALAGGIGIITALSAYTLFGRVGVFWAIALIGAFSLIGPRVAPEAIMRMLHARPIHPGSSGDLLRLVQALATRAGLSSMPKLYVVPGPTLNAFAVGTRSHYSLGVTDGLLRRLDFRELAGVLAHEISHVRNNDIWVMSLADILSRFTRSMSFFAMFLFFVSVPVSIFTGTPVPWAAIVLLYFAPALSSLLQLALSRSREFDADLGGAMLTGDPEGLASALGKLERYQGRSWEDIFMPGWRMPLPSVLRTHPPTSERIARLMALRRSETASHLFSRPEFLFRSLQAAGGIILLIIALDMIFESRIGGSTISQPEGAEARAKNGEIAVFPLATPILAGPGAMSGAMLLMANTGGNLLNQIAVIAALLTVMAFTLLLLLAAQEIREWVGVTAQKVLMRVFGILLAAIAVQSVFNGIAGSGIFARSL